MHACYAGLPMTKSYVKVLKFTI